MFRMVCCPCCGRWAIEKGIPKLEDAEAFEKTGRINWVASLAEIPEQ